jgi:hypothetical protein
MFRTQSHFARSRRLKIECLERRSLLAGNITASVVDGVLQITGDNQNNDLEITQTEFNSGGEWNGVTLNLRGRNAAGDITTTINGGIGGAFAGVKNGVVISLNKGDDYLQVRKDSSNRTPNLPGQVSISGGHGADDLRIYARNHNSLTVHAGWGEDEVLISGSTVNRLTVHTNSQATDIHPDELVTLRGVEASQAVNVVGGAGDDLIEFENRCVFDGSVTIQLGEGENHVFFSAHAQNEDPTLNGTFRVVGGSDRDHISGAGRFLGNVDVDTAGGKDFVLYVGTTSTNTIDISTGAGDDRVVLRGNNFGSGVVDGGSGHDELFRPEDIDELTFLNFEEDTIDV